MLPFENVGAAEDAYFADGITEEVRGKLTAVPGLRVTARTSTNAYKGTKKSLLTSATSWVCEYMLTGTDSLGERPRRQRHVRVTPELVRRATARRKWQQPFDAVMSDVFKVQSGIAADVAKALDVTLAQDVQQKLNNAPDEEHRRVPGVPARREGDGGHGAQRRPLAAKGASAL